MIDWMKEGRNREIWFLLLSLVIALTGLLAAACVEEAGAAPVLTEVEGGDPERGRQAIKQYGCGTCHTIPGVAGANAHVGPPLTDFARRQYIAGALLNNPDNLMRWIMSPDSVEPGTAMPSMNVTPDDARDIAAYLSTLK